jgi:hypothetical protein
MISIAEHSFSLSDRCDQQRYKMQAVAAMLGRDNDVPLIDVRHGYIVDAIHGFFW